MTPVRDILAGFTIPGRLAKAGPYIAGVLLAVLILSLTYCAGGDKAEAEAENERLVAEVEFNTVVEGANTEASEERVDDVLKRAEEEDVLNDAMESNPPGDSRRSSRGCHILRQQGFDTSGTPACN